MKAKDLAALAALGVAGYAAYNKFGKKDEEPKLRGKLGASGSAVDDSAGEYRSDMLGQGRSANEGDAGESEARMSKRSRQENDVPDRIMGKDAAGSRFTDRAAAESPVIGKDAAGSRFTDKAAAEAPAATSSGYNKLRAAGANSKTPAAALSGAVVPAPAVVEAAPKTRAFTPPGVQDSMGAFTKAGQADAAAPTTRAFTPPGYVASANDYNRASAPNMPSSAALGDYTRAINPAMQADRMAAAASPSARMTDKLAVTSRANQAAYLAQQRAEQARLDALRSSGGRRAKGGAVKMAKGGLASSKMSKPSGASRGDGIAQRGRTRGTLR
jgi:hypothetical protein